MQARKHRLLAVTLLGCLLFIASVSRPVGAQTNFGEVDLASTASNTVTVQIPGAATLSSIAVVTQGAPNLDFTNAGGGTCATGVAYAANATCTVRVTFAPQFAGPRYGAVVLADESGVIGTTYLQGTGQGPQLTFLPDSQSTVAFGGVVDGIANWWPDGIAVDGSGNVYFTNSRQPYQLFRETPSNGGYIQSVVPTSPLGDPFGVAVDGAGNVYVADCDHFRVLKETVTASGYAESTVASFPVVDGSAPVGVAVDGSGNVYISLGVEAGIVYKETLTASGYVQSTVVSGLPCDAGIAVDGSGDVYIAVDETNGWIVKATPSVGGYAQTTIPVNGEGVPVAVAVDASGSLYVAFTYSDDDGQVFKETPDNGSYTQSTIPTSGLIEAFGVALDARGNIYIDDYYNGRIVKETLAAPPALRFAATPLGSTSSDSPQSVTVSNIGNADLAFSALSFPADFPESSGASDGCTSSTSLAPGANCAVSVDFTPVTPLDGTTSAVLTENVKLTTNALPETQSITVTGTETAAAAPSFSIAGTAISIAPGATTGNTSTITLTPSGGFTGVITLSCAITPIAASDPATCSIPASVTISGSTAQTTTLTVYTTSATTSLNQFRRFFPPSVGGAALACILLVGIPVRRRRWRVLGMAVLLFSILGSIPGCSGGGSAGSGGTGGGGGGNRGTTPGTYSVTITGTSGTITQTGLVTLTVQ